MSLLSKELKDTKYLETIKKIQFSLLNPDEIREASVCEITIPETYDGTEPKINGLLDPRMGVLELRKKCPTDEHDSEICPGYFGHIELARPVFHIHFMSFILKVLRCVCYRCSNILIDKSDIYTMREIEKRTGRSRFAYVLQNCIKTKLCEFNDCCNAIQPSKYVKLTSDKIKDRDNIVKIVGEFNETAISSESKINKNQLFTPEMCYNIFKNISEEDVEILGFNNKYSRPEWMICKVLPVPPPYVRPSVRQDNNQRAEDDLTHALINIVKHNNILRNKIEANADKKTIDIYEGCLQLCIATYIDNELPKVKPLMHRSGKPLKTLKKRLKGKDGRIRGNLMGKRVDRSARSVISCDPNIMIDQLGVPIKIAMNITYPEKVTKWNKDQLYKYVRNGPNKYPGAKFINRMEIDCNGVAAPCEISLRYVDPNKIVLQEGDEVHRHLLDDDIVLFNRQPSLHRMSMMAHRVKVVKHNTFRLNNTVTKPYNADFDGDEMNMHQPPNWQTRVEIENLALVPTQIISPANCGPIISIVQDTLVGSYLFTATGAKIGRYELNNLMMFNQNFDGNLLEPNDNGKWSGNRVYSMILPNISINEKDIVVDKGVMTSGILKKGTINNSLVKLIYSVYGPNVCKDFLDSTQSLITRWLITHSFSIGYGDCLIDKSIREESKKKLDEKLEVANDILRKVHKGDFYENIVNNTLRQNIFESEMKAKLGEASESSYKIIQAKLKELSYKNSFVAVTSLGAGAKGDDTNLRKIMSNLGQYTIWGSRIPTNFTDRTLPHYPKFDESPQSKGFCKNSFIEGLTPTESFFTAMSGRSTSIDTAIKTSESGYISRKLIKALEDLKVNYDYSIRNANNVIVQFVYGDDNFDPTKLERQSFKLIEYDNNKMKEEFYIIYDNKTNWSLYFTDDIVKEIKKDKEMLEIFDIEYDKLMKYREVLRKDIYKNLDVIGAVQVYSPFNLSRIIHQAIKKFNSGYKCNISPKYIYYELDKLYENITKYFKKHNNSNLILVRMIIESQLSIKNVIVKYKLDKDTFDYIIKQVELKVISSFIQPGELVGVVSAQSLGEPTTQMTLNSVSYETEILLEVENEIKHFEIGKFIDDHIIHCNPNDIENHPNNTILAWIKDKNIRVQSVDENGVTSWQKVEAVTRHPVINLDGTDTVIRVETDGGRSVIATKAKSFLGIIDNKLLEIDGGNLKVGDYLPINIKSHNGEDIIPNYKIDGKEYIHETRSFIEKLNGSKVFPDIIFEKIIKIEEIPNTTEWVYDLTVENTRNFILENNLCMRDTFHSTGVSSKSVVTSTGVPRMRELLNHSKNIRTKSMTIYLKNELQFDKNKADLMKYQLQFTTIADIINTSEIIYEKNKPEYMNEEDVYMKSYEMFNEIIGLDNINMISPWTLKLTFDPDSLLNSNILMSELQEAIISNDAFEDHIKPFFTDDNSSNLVLKIKIGDFKDDEDSIQFLKEIEKHILCIKLRGITGIRKVGMEEMNIVRYYEDGSCENAKEWTLNTDGSNLLELMTYDDIDSERTTSNDINEILEIFGIEGARSKYIEEFQYIMQESGVNYRHIELLADIMTYKGTVMQIDRHGINKSADNGPIKKATFEETGDVLVNSAIFAEVDKMKGVSANVMFGQYPRAGTNAFDILIDDNMIINNQEIDEEEDIDYIGDEEIDINQIDKQLEEDFKNKTGKLDKVNDSSFILDAGIHTVNIKPIKKKMNKVEVKII